MEKMEANLTNSNGNIINQSVNYTGILDNLIFNLELLEELINTIYNNLDKNSLNDNLNLEKLHRDIPKKNKINRLSDDTYNNIIKDNVEEYFKIKDFLSRSENKILKERYLAIKKSLYPGVIAAIDQGKTMDEVLNTLNAKFSTYFNKAEKLKENDDSFIYCSGFFYYMYYICDIGKNE